MKVTTELLERHGMGLCTEEEKKAIKQWFKTLDDPSMNLPVTPEVDEDRIWSKMSQSVPELQGYVGTPTLPLHRRVVRYAAAACIILAAFFGGRFSSSSANAREIIDKSPKDHLYIFGMDDTKGHLSGNEFELEFNGRVKLFNGAINRKTINVGDTSFILESYHTYYVDGTLQEPTILSSNRKTRNVLNSDILTGDFSVLRIDK